MRETRTLEFKETITNTFLKTVSAFSNYDGGSILFGIDDNGNVKWEYQLPDKLNRHYSASDIASFSRWYLDDYPVFCWSEDYGLFVTGLTKGSLWKYNYNSSPAVLKGPGYAAPVTYWMPFSGGVGIHDATWRSRFGGQIYITNGSHGCVNTPKDQAAIIYNNISVGVPIVVYE